MSTSNWRLSIFASLIIICISLLAGEGLLRLFGFQVFVPTITKVSSVPMQALLPDGEMGIQLNPGSYEITLHPELSYQATHIGPYTRTTGNEDGSKNIDVVIYGCSITYGMGVNDAETYPYLLQERFPDLAIANKSVPAYGTTQALLLLKKAVAKKISENFNLPKVVVLGYSGLHDARNRMTGLQQRYWKNTLSQSLNQTQATSVNFPIAKTINNQLYIDQLALDNFSDYSALSRHSVLSYRLENAFSNIYYGFKDNYLLTEKIFAEINAICLEHDIQLLILGLDQTGHEDQLSAFCEAREIEYIASNIDLYDSLNNLQPYDSHPNAKVHETYAALMKPKLEAMLREFGK